MVLLCSKWWKLMGSQSWATSWPVIGVNPQWREDIPTLHTEASQNRKNSWESGNIIFILQHPGKTFPSFCGKPFGFFRHRTSTEAPLEAKNAMLPVRSAWWDWWAWRSHPTWWLAARWPLGANRRHPKIIKNQREWRSTPLSVFFLLTLFAGVPNCLEIVMHCDAHWTQFLWVASQWSKKPASQCRKSLEDRSSQMSSDPPLMHWFMASGCFMLLDPECSVFFRNKSN